MITLGCEDTLGEGCAPRLRAGAAESPRNLNHKRPISAGPVEGAPGAPASASAAMPPTAARLAGGLAVALTAASRRPSSGCTKGRPGGPAWVSGSAAFNFDVPLSRGPRTVDILLTEIRNFCTDARNDTPPSPQIDAHCAQ